MELIFHHVIIKISAVPCETKTGNEYLTFSGYFNFKTEVLIMVFFFIDIFFMSVFFSLSFRDGFPIPTNGFN